MNTHNPQQAEPTRSRGPKRSDRPGRAPHKNMVWVPGGTFLMGSNDFYPEERPVHRVTVDGFWMDEHAVTNAEFRRFVKATGHITVAERPADPADYPGARPEMLVPSFRGVPTTSPPRRPAQPLQLVGLRAGSELAPPRGSRQHPPRPGAASGGARRLRGRRGLRELGGQRASHRGRVGVRRPRGAGGRDLRLGERVLAEGQDDGEHLAGRVSHREPADRQVRADSAYRVVPTERLRAVRRDGERLGMDYGLVSGSSRARKCLLRQRQPYHRRPGAELRPADARRPHPAQGDQGRFVPVRAQLLSALPTGGAHAPPGRYRYVPHRVPLHRSPPETPS